MDYVDFTSEELTPPVTVVESGDHNRNSTLLGCLGIGVGALLLWRLLNKESSNPPPNPITLPEAGFQAVYYGGPHGLGVLVGLKNKTTSARLNQFNSVWCCTDIENGFWFFVDETMHWYRTQWPLEFELDSTSEQYLLKVEALSDEQTKAAIEKFSAGNKQEVRGGYFDIVDTTVLFGESTEYESGRPTEIEVLFPVPQNVSGNSAWYIDKATVKIIPYRRLRTHWTGVNNLPTNVCEIQVSGPGFSYTSVQTAKKSQLLANRFRPMCITARPGTSVAALLSMGISLAFSENYETMQLWRSRQYQTVYQSSVHEDRWETIKRVVRSWMGPDGLLTNGRTEIKNLCSGFAGLKQACTIFGSGNWVNGSFDAVDCLCLFRSLLLTPKPTCLAHIDDMTEFEKMLKCFAASTNAVGYPVTDGQVAVPSWWKGFRQFEEVAPFELLPELAIYLEQGLSLRSAMQTLIEERIELISEPYTQEQ
jgi:hypothetical protein